MNSDTKLFFFEKNADIWYRAYDTENKKFIYGVPLYTENELRMYKLERNEVVYESLHNSTAVQRYIGKADGTKDIYEGDFVELNRDPGDTPGILRIIGEVDNCGRIWDAKDELPLLECINPIWRTKIIGNNIENPDLLSNYR